MTFDNKKSNSQHKGLESFFPSLSENESTPTVKISITTILIRRRSDNSDTWICNSCTLTGDKWFMEKHPCKQNVKNNFAKVGKRFQEY